MTAELNCHVPLSSAKRARAKRTCTRTHPLFDVLGMYRVPERPLSATMRLPVSGINKINGVGENDARGPGTEIQNFLLANPSIVGQKFRNFC